MSNESLHKFLKLLAENKEAAAKVKEMGGNIEAVVKYGRELGFEFDRGEIEEYQRQVINLFKAKTEKKLQEAMPQKRPGAEQLRRLMLLAEADETVAKRLEKIGPDNPQVLIDYGREKGFVFDAEDMRAFAKEIIEQSDELSDEELEVAAGGLVSVFVAVGVISAVAFIGAVASAVGVGVGVVGTVLATAAVSKK